MISLLLFAFLSYCHSVYILKQTDLQQICLKAYFNKLQVIRDRFQSVCMYLSIRSKAVLLLWFYILAFNVCAVYTSHKYIKFG